MNNAGLSYLGAFIRHSSASMEVHRTAAKRYLDVRQSTYPLSRNHLQSSI